jgi:hypothetical protein
MGNYGLGIAHLWAGNAEESFQQVQKVIDQSPNDPLMHGFQALESEH